ncbi:MAG: sulfurtransferase complex subunit TusB [Nitrospirae bacterium]|nr:sulfurtransferase complex subunit TusB [Nitrospirota bacterium]MBI5694577.1 sulfurtransferase complex subunit TusB [Nitrospirota bacterium]
MLHIVSRSPFSDDSLKSCVRIAKKDDPILLTEDAVTGVMPGSAVASLLQDAMKSHAVYALSADLKARGVDRMLDGIKVVDYAGFVELVEQHKPMTWL